jgi:purine-binding chemotaxis protein CheW
MDAETQRILRERAARLARPTIREEKGGGLDVVEFSLGSERYAFPAKDVCEAAPLKDFSPLPGVPAWIAGIVNLRGAILTVLDLRPLLAPPAARSVSEMPQILFLFAADAHAGVLADTVLGVHEVSAENLQGSFATNAGIRTDHVRGVASDGLIILDAGKLLSDESLLVRDAAEI